MDFDVVIRNAKIVNTEGITCGDIYIKGEKVAAITESGGPQYRAKNEIDVQGQYVLPGLIDGHMHIAWPGGTDWALSMNKDTAAAAAGGVTTVIHCLFEHASGSIVEGLGKFVEVYEANAYVDLGINAAVFTLDQIAEMEDALENGVSSFKFLFPYRGREALPPLPGIDDGILYLGFEQIGKLVRKGYNTFARIHPESIEVFFRLEDRFKAMGAEPGSYTEARPNFLEVEAIQRCAVFARETGCPLFVVHMTIKEGPALIKRYQAEGLDIVAETCPQYLVLNVDNADKRLSKVNPPIRHKEDNESLWQGICNGAIDYMGTDHAPTPISMKKGDLFRDCLVGMGAVQTWLPIMLSEGVNKGRISLERLVAVTSYNVAKKYGLLPNKGRIAVGADADLVVVDLSKVKKVKVEDLYDQAGFSCYDGWELKGWPVMTMVRGSIVAQDGKVTGASGFGRFVPARMK